MKSFFFFMLLYSIVYNLTGLVFHNDGITAAAMCIYTAILIFYCLRRGNTKGQSFVFIGQAFAFTKIKMLFTLLLFGFCVPNIIFLNGISASVLCSLLGAVCEELLFRGFLLSDLKKKGALVATLTGAFLFALYHLISGGGPVQAICSFSIGVAFSLYVLKYGSLFFCILAHLLINFFGDAQINTVVALVCSSVTVICGYFLYKTKEK